MLPYGGLWTRGTITVNKNCKCIFGCGISLSEDQAKGKSGQKASGKPEQVTDYEAGMAGELTQSC